MFFIGKSKGKRNRKTKAEYQLQKAEKLKAQRILLQEQARLIQAQAKINQARFDGETAEMDARMDNISAHKEFYHALKGHFGEDGISKILDHPKFDLVLGMLTGMSQGKDVPIQTVEHKPVKAQSISDDEKKILSFLADNPSYKKMALAEINKRTK